MTLADLPAAAERAVLLAAGVAFRRDRGGFRRRPRRLARARRSLGDLRRNPTLAAVFLALLFVLAGGVLVYTLESGSADTLYHSYWDGVWWAVVTMTTVGYGDAVPHTALGRLVGVTLMIGGVATVSLMTANIASALVSENLREARGVENVRWSGHVLLCGWNQHAERVVDSLAEHVGESPFQLVLVNNLPEEAILNVLSNYRDLQVRFVRGSHASEAVLERANVRAARAAVVLADMMAGTAADADDSTVLAALALKHLNPSIRVIGEILDGQNAVHLRRANADEVVVSGEHNPFLLAASVASPGLSQAVRLLLGSAPGAELRRAPVPPQFVGQSFASLSAYFRQRHDALLLGLITERKGITLDEMLGSDSSSIDDFIRRKFAEAGMTGRAWDAEGQSVTLNPDPGHVVGPQDAAIVVSRAPLP